MKKDFDEDTDPKLPKGDSWGTRSIKAMKLLSEQKPATLEDMRAQVVQMFKRSKQPLTAEEEAIWSDTTRSEFNRYTHINAKRIAPIRAKLRARKERWERGEFNEEEDAIFM